MLRSRCWRQVYKEKKEGYLADSSEGWETTQHRNGGTAILSGVLSYKTMNHEPPSSWAHLTLTFPASLSTDTITQSIRASAHKLRDVSLQYGGQVFLVMLDGRSCCVGLLLGVMQSQWSLSVALAPTVQPYSPAYGEGL